MKAYPHISVSAAQHVIYSGMLTVARGLRRGIFDKLECLISCLSVERAPPPIVKHVVHSAIYVSPASTARHLYLRGGVGVGAMIKVYGGRQRNGVCPAHFSVGSRNVARKVLQALEGLKMVEKDPNG